MKYRKKPVVIDAMQMPTEPDQDAVDAIVDWIEAGGSDVSDTASNALWIDTLEGTMMADLGDWIIRGVQGEFYPCKPDIFEATYDRIETIITHHPEVSA